MTNIGKDNRGLMSDNYCENGKIERLKMFRKGMACICFMFLLHISAG